MDKPPGRDSMLSNSSVSENGIASKPLTFKKCAYTTGYLSLIMSASCKSYILVKLFLNLNSFSVKDLIYTYLDKNSFVHAVVANASAFCNYLGLIVILLEIIYSLFLRYKIFDYEFSMVSKVNYYKYFCLVFPLGLINEIVLHNIGVQNLSEESNFFITLYKIKLYALIVIVIIIMVALALVIAAFCCGKGEYLGTYKTTSYWSNGNTIVSYHDEYAPDYESMGNFCSCGISC